MQTVVASPVKRIKLEPDATQNSEQPKSINALDFLKSRPQISTMEKSNFKDLQKAQDTHGSAHEDTKPTLEDTRFEGNLSAWQHNETIQDFLRRLPVDDPKTENVGPWLWVGNPQIKISHREHERQRDEAAFVKGGQQLLNDFLNMKSKIEATNKDKAPQTITRYMRPYREQLENDLHQLAVKSHLTTGKWMLFPLPEDLPRTWRLVAEATAAGKLGSMAKVASGPNYLNPKPERLICVYTYDFSDTADVRRVLDGLLTLEGVPERGIYYKCDAYTHLDIISNNPYKLKASMYSSKELLEGNSRAKKDGTIVRTTKTMTPASSGSVWEF
jgi:hypothetical protein